MEVEVEVLGYVEMQTWANERPNYLILPGMLNRPGVRAFAACLEYRHYPPNTPANWQFELVLTKFAEMLWLVIGVPKQDISNVRGMAKACGLRLADGVPRLLSSEGLESFPVDRPNVWTLGNQKGHPVYGGLKVATELAEAESLLLAHIFATGVVPDDAEIKQRLLGE